jgi:acyl-CoA thioester hydrolase
LNNGLNIRGPEKLRFLVIETGIRYFSEAGFPDLIHAGLRLGHLGNSSLRFEVGLFRNDEDQTCAEGFFAEVLTDNDSQPIPIPDPVRAKLTPLILG